MTIGLVLFQAASFARLTAVAAEVPIYAAHFQHHSQDDFGGYNYGYSNKDSAKQEVRNPDGTVAGTYRQN